MRDLWGEHPVTGGHQLHRQAPRRCRAVAALEGAQGLLPIEVTRVVGW